MSVNHFGNVQPLLDNEEHEHNYEPATKRVMPYGWDGTTKRTIKVNTDGSLVSGETPPTDSSKNNASVSLSQTDLVVATTQTLTKVISGTTYTSTLSFNAAGDFLSKTAWVEV